MPYALRGRNIVKVAQDAVQNSIFKRRPCFSMFKHHPIFRAEPHEQLARPAKLLIDRSLFRPRISAVCPTLRPHTQCRSRTSLYISGMRLIARESISTSSDAAMRSNALSSYEALCSSTVSICSILSRRCFSGSMFSAAFLAAVSVYARTRQASSSGSVLMLRAIPSSAFCTASSASYESRSILFATKTSARDIRNISFRISLYPPHRQ